MAPLVTWDEEEAKTHLEVRSEGDWRTIHIEGDIARSQKDWVYWRLPTAITKQAVTPEEGAVELAVRLERGEARVGLIAEGVKPGENWNEEKMRDAAYFLDPFFGVLRSGDIDLAAGSSLKAVQVPRPSSSSLTEIGVTQSRWGNRDEYPTLGDLCDLMHLAT
jgi:hypothetical protein